MLHKIIYSAWGVLRRKCPIFFLEQSLLYSIFFNQRILYFLVHNIYNYVMMLTVAT